MPRRGHKAVCEVQPAVARLSGRGTKVVKQLSSNCPGSRVSAQRRPKLAVRGQSCADGGLSGPSCGEACSPSLPHHHHQLNTGTEPVEYQPHTSNVLTQRPNNTTTKPSKISKKPNNTNSVPIQDRYNIRTVPTQHDKYGSNAVPMQSIPTSPPTPPSTLKTNSLELPPPVHSTHNCGTNAVSTQCNARLDPLGGPNTARIGAWSVVPTKSRKVHACGLNRCEPGSHRMDLDEHRSMWHGATSRSSQWHSGPPRPQFSVFVFRIPFLGGPLRIRKSCTCEQVDGSGTERFQGNDG